MGKEINLLKNYPKSNRNINERLASKTEENRYIARKFDKEFFDGDRSTGYGGFKYNEKYWKNVVSDFKDYWKLKDDSSILDVGCAKGFMLYDFKKLLPNLKVKGVDISKYAIEYSIENIKPYLEVCDAKNLPYNDNEFDFVISINTVHNLDKLNCIKAIKEIERVAKYNSFITVDAFSNEEEKKKMFAWNLTAKTILSTFEWKKLLEDCKYTGDYFWFIP